MVSSITLLVLYGLFVVWTCLVIPAWNLAWLLGKYLGGKTPWAGDLAPDAVSPPPVVWSHFTPAVDLPVRPKGSPRARA